MGGSVRHGMLPEPPDWHENRQVSGLLGGRLLSRSGAAPTPILRRKLSAEHLARAVNRIIVDPRLTDNAIHLSENVGQEDDVSDDVSRAVDLIIQRFLPKQDVA